MTQTVNPTAAVADTNLGQPPTVPDGPAAKATPPAAPAQPAAPDQADLRLVIEDDKAAGCFVYKTVDWRTGAVVAQLPREQLLKLRETSAYLAGDVIKTVA